MCSHSLMFLLVVVWFVKLFDERKDGEVMFSSFWSISVGSGSGLGASLVSIVLKHSRELAFLFLRRKLTIYTELRLGSATNCIIVLHNHLIIGFY